MTDQSNLATFAVHIPGHGSDTLIVPNVPVDTARGFEQEWKTNVDGREAAERMIADIHEKGFAFIRLDRYTAAVVLRANETQFGDALKQSESEEAA